MYVRSVAAAIVCAYVCPAFADPSEADIKKASALFDEAEKKFKIGEYQLALADYKASYLLTGEPALLFNIGQCHRFLGNDQEAIKSYKIFLRDANPDGSSRALAEKLITELESKSPTEQKATLEAKAPSGAEGAIFFLDGAAVGPLPISTALTPGTHNVELRRDNVILYAESVEIKPGETRSLSISISKEPTDPSKTEGVLLRFSTPLAERGFDIDIVAGVKTVKCADPVRLNTPCELRVPSNEEVRVRIGDCADYGFYCHGTMKTLTLNPTIDSNMSLKAPKASRLGRTLLVLGIPVGVIGAILRVSSPFDPFGPVNPDPFAPPQPGERIFFIGSNLLIAGAISTVVGGGLTIARSRSIKKYYESNPTFVPLTTTP